MLELLRGIPCARRAVHQLHCALCLDTYGGAASLLQCVSGGELPLEKRLCYLVPFRPAQLRTSTREQTAGICTSQFSIVSRPRWNLIASRAHWSECATFPRICQHSIVCCTSSPRILKLSVRYFQLVRRIDLGRHLSVPSSGAHFLRLRFSDSTWQLLPWCDHIPHW
jgi:hypothetical protein